MGLPIWREPSPKSTAKETVKNESQDARDRVTDGGIRRRVIHRHYRTDTHVEAIRRARQRQRVLYPPQLELFETTLPGSNAAVTTTQRQTDGHSGVPPISTLLETTDRRALAPPPVPESRNYFAAERQTHDNRIERIGRDVADLRMRLIAETNAMVARFGRRGTTIPSADEPTIDLRQQPLPETESDSANITALRRAEPLINHAVQTGSTRIDGLGDRNRSPTPAEEWEVMRSTIQPDTTLPSAESSFTSAAASHSFTGGSRTSASTSATDLDDMSSQDPAHIDSDDDSTSSLELGDICADEEDGHDALARDMYYSEMESPEGRERIAEQEALRNAEGNRYAMSDESASVDIGFRLIEAALERVEVRHRTLRLGGQSRPSAAEYGPDLIRLSSIIEYDRSRQSASRRTSRALEPETSTDAPEAHPVSPPIPQAQRDSGESFIANIERGDQDLDAMRQIVELLASREDVPDEWWMSMGLNFSRTRPRRNRDGGSTVRDSRVEAELARVRSGRVERPRDDTRDRASRL